MYGERAGVLAGVDEGAGRTWNFLMKDDPKPSTFHLVFHEQALRTD